MIIFTAPGIAKQYSGKHFAVKNPARKEKSFKNGFLARRSYL